MQPHIGLFLGFFKVNYTLPGIVCTELLTNMQEWNYQIARSKLDGTSSNNKARPWHVSSHGNHKHHKHDLN